MKNKFCLKFAAIQVCALAYTSTFAALPNNLDKVNHWYVGLDGLYMRPYDIDNLEGKVGTDLPSSFRLNANYQAGAQIFLGYYLTQQNDVFLSYTFDHFSDSHSQSTGDQLSPDQFSMLTAQNNNFMKYYDAYNLNFGHQFLGDLWSTHLFAGLDYTHIKIINYSNSTNLFTDRVEHSVSRSNYIFEGLGPQLGFNSTFKFTRLINLTGGANISLLKSNITNSYNYVPKTYSLALKTEAHLGLSYDFHINKVIPATIEAGYKALIVQNQGAEGGILGVGLTDRFNFSMSGPYLGFKMTL